MYNVKSTLKHESKGTSGKQASTKANYLYKYTKCNLISVTRCSEYVLYVSDKCKKEIINRLFKFFRSLKF